MIQNGQKVSLEYRVFLEDGTQVDSNIGEAPLIFTFGSHQIFPALEEEVMVLERGERKKFILTPEEAYGPVMDDAYREIELEKVPTPYRYEGAVLGVQDPEGGVFPIRVHKIQNEKAVLDFNHPLAGKSLHFDVRVVEIL